MKPAWRRLHSELLGDVKVFTVRRDRIVSPPRSQEEHDFYILDGRTSHSLVVAAFAKWPEL